MNEVIHIKRDIPGTKTNNEAYYISLIEGLKTTRMYRANGISVYTNSELVCRKMKGIYQVRKVNSKPLHVEVRTIAGEFHFFTINHHSDINRMYVDLMNVNSKGGVKTYVACTLLHISDMCVFSL